MEKSFGILVYKISAEGKPEFLLVHPGGPFFKRKDEGAWTIPKGGAEPGEEPLAAAIREFREETGVGLAGAFAELEPVRQKAGKLVVAWAFEEDLDVSTIVSNHFEIEWPPRSGKKQSFPEIDKAAWFGLETAKIKINPAQVSLLTQVIEQIQKKKSS